jgi:hypothetical protein
MCTARATGLEHGLSGLVAKDRRAVGARSELEHLAHEGRAPERGAVLVHVLEQLPVVLRAHLGGRRDRFVDRVRDLLAVPRVDDDRAVQRLRGARELGEDHHALAGLLARDVLVRHLVSTVERVGAVRGAAGEGD